jgi:hypothetical protein
MTNEHWKHLLWESEQELKGLLAEERASHARTKAALRQVQWAARTIGYDPMCASCLHMKSEGHAPQCIVGKSLEESK